MKCSVYVKRTCTNCDIQDGRGPATSYSNLALMSAVYSLEDHFARVRNSAFVQLSDSRKLSMRLSGSNHSFKKKLCQLEATQSYNHTRNF